MIFIINFNYICESFLHNLLELIQFLGRVPRRACLRGHGGEGRHALYQHQSFNMVSMNESLIIDTLTPVLCNLNWIVDADAVQ